jgi:ribosomal protein L7/L12
MANWRELTFPEGEKTWLNLDRAEGITKDGPHTLIQFSGGTVRVVETPQQILGSASDWTRDVIVTDAGGQKINVIRAVRQLTGWDVRICLDHVDRHLPIPVPAQAMEAFTAELSECGATFCGRDVS